MQYNTVRPKLSIAAYGRNVQNMVKHALTVEDREERNKVAQAIISVMGQINPALRDIEDYKSKLWVHMYIISDYKLDVDYPCELPAKEEFEKKPSPLPYPQTKIKFGHYGKTIEELVKLASDYEEGEEKNALVLMIANMMKRNYLGFSRNAVDDELIKEHLLKLSNGKIKMDDTIQLIHTNTILRESGGTNNAKRKKSQQKNNHHKNNQNKNHKHHNQHRKSQSR